VGPPERVQQPPRSGEIAIGLTAEQCRILDEVDLAHASGDIGPDQRAVVQDAELFFRDLVHDWHYVVTAGSVTSACSMELSRLLSDGDLLLHRERETASWHDITSLLRRATDLALDVIGEFQLQPTGTEQTMIWKHLTDGRMLTLQPESLRSPAVKCRQVH